MSSHPSPETTRFLPRDRRVEVRPLDGVAAPVRPSRLWVSWPWEPFLTLGGSVFLLAGVVLLLVPLGTPGTVLVALAAVLGLAVALLGVAISRVRRHREVRSYRHASTALLASRDR